MSGYEAPPSISVSAAELKSWLFDAALKLRPLLPGPSGTLSELVELGAAGVFIGAAPGLVVWLMPRDLDAIDRAAARQFTLDADLIVGGIQLADHIAIIGREREAPLRVLPPLRHEMIQRLAESSNAAELAQSFERNHTFAGRMYSDLDWAPIYLSAALIDTEFGSLLNITDQILKSWSEAGYVDYANFVYPRPDSYVFGNDRLWDLLEDVQQILYNWNTVGLGSTVDYGDFVIFALDRTGSLPVTYGSDLSSDEEGLTFGALAQYEEKAYDYFPNLQDPSLQRVVQYTAIYQIFRHLGLAIEKVGPYSGNHSAITALEDTAKSVLDQLFLSNLTLNEEGLSSIGDHLADENEAASYESFARDMLPAISSDFMDLEAAGIDDPLTRLASFIAAPRSYVGAELQQEEVDRAWDKFYVNLDVIDAIGPSEARELVSLTENEKRIVTRFAFSNMLPDLDPLIDVLAQPDEVFEQFARAVETDVIGPIHTARIVVSWRTDTPMLIGGHNISGKVTDIIIDSRVQAGRPLASVGQDGAVVLRVNPADAAAVGRMPRMVERLRPGENVDDALRRQVAQGGELRVQQDALRLSAVSRNAERGLSVAEQRSPALDGIGWRARPVLSDVARDLEGVVERPSPFAVAVRQTSDGHVVVIRNASPPPTVVMYTTRLTATVADILGSLGPQLRSITGKAANDNFPIFLKGYAENEVHGLMQTISLAGARQNRFGRIVVEGDVAGEIRTIPQAGGAGGGSKGLNYRVASGRAEPPRRSVLSWITRRGDDVFPWQSARVRRLEHTDPDVAQFLKGGDGAAFAVEIPSAQAGTQGLFLKVLSLFRRKPDPAAVDAIESAIVQARDVAASQQRTLIDTLSSLKVELLEAENLRSRGLTNVEFIVKEADTGDIVITRLDGASDGRAPG